jgi:hypothetical protein
LSKAQALGKTENDDGARAERDSGSVAAAIQSMKIKTPAGVANGHDFALRSFGKSSALHALIRRATC